MGWRFLSWRKIPDLICHKELMSPVFWSLGTPPAVTHAPNSEAKDGNVSIKSRRSKKSTVVVVHYGKQILRGELFHKLIN